MDHRKATRVLLCWEAVVFRLQKCEENTRNKITARLHRKNIKHMLFSQKIGIVGSSKCIKYPCVFPLRTRGSGGRSRAVVQGEAVQPNPCSSCWGGRLFLGLLWLLPKQPLPLMQFKKLHNGGKNKRALVD